MTTLSLKTKTVALKDGTRVVINVSDFDPKLHTEVVKRPPEKKQKDRDPRADSRLRRRPGVSAIGMVEMS